MRLLFILGVCWVLGLAARAQTVSWKTNYYSVSGTNLREVRESIGKTRPWKDNFDAITEWQVKWQFTLKSSGGECRCSGSTTTTTITTTLPRWSQPADASPEAKEGWSKFIRLLGEHEAGHARLALAAGAEVRKQLATVETDSDCDRLKQKLNDSANKIVEAYRAREKEYDRRTQHGMRP